MYLVGFDLLAPLWQVALAFALAMPSGIDWLTQTWGFRLSTNRIRLLVGFLIGAGAGLLGLSSLPNAMKLLILAYSSSGVILAGYLGRIILRWPSPSLTRPPTHSS